MTQLSSERMLQLMAYADGELEGDERRAVERSLVTDLDAARFVNEIAGLGDLVQTGHGTSKTAQTVASFDIADSVIAAIGREAPAATVTSLGALRAKRSTRFTTIGMAAAALALAASFVMMARSRYESPMAAAPMSPAPSSEPGVEVDVSESPGDSVRVFYLSSETSKATSVIVWVDEPGGK